MSGDAGYNTLIYDICARMGWCGSVVDGKPRHVDHYIPGNGEVSADQFVEWVFLAEGYHPHENGEERTNRHRIALRETFIRHMGSEMIDAQRLKRAQ
jgi:hypothetical protein